MYQKNKDTIKMTNSGSYFIDQEKVNQYIEANCIEESKEILRFIFDNIRYVPFNEFYEALSKYVVEIDRVHRNGDSDMVIKVYVIIPSEEGTLNTKKSNFWVTLLIKKIIEELDIKNFNIIGVINKIKDFPKGLDDTYIGLFPDDCAYSGAQSAVELFKKSLSLENKVYVIIPYICTMAFALFKTMAHNTGNNNNIIFLDDCINFIKSFTEICFEKDFNMYEKDVYYLEKNKVSERKQKEAFSYTGLPPVKFKYEEYLTKSLIRNIVKLPESGALVYFDHKVADQLSTIQYFLNYSVVLSKKKILVNRPKNRTTDLFNIFKEIFAIAEYNYFNKPFTFTSRVMKEQGINENDPIFSFCLGNKFNDNYILELKTHEPKEYIVCSKKDHPTSHYNVINNCEKKDLPRIRDELLDSTDLNNSKLICPTTFYKQDNFYTLVGGYYEKYTNIKTQYLDFKKNIKHNVNQ